MRSFFKSLLILAVIAPILGACGDSTGPDSYPIILRPKSVENKSAIRVFANDGGTWKEITSTNPSITSDPFFAESAMVQDDDPSFKLISDTLWRDADGLVDTALAYSHSGDAYTFTTFFTNVNIYGNGSTEEMRIHFVAAFGSSGSNIRFAYPGGSNPFDAVSDIGSDTIAYQTFDLVYKPE